MTESDIRELAAEVRQLRAEVRELRRGQANIPLHSGSGGGGSGCPFYSAVDKTALDAITVDAPAKGYTESPRMYFYREGDSETGTWEREIHYD